MTELSYEWRAERLLGRDLAATTRRPKCLSGSTVSRAFIQASATKLPRAPGAGPLREDVVALVLDGKTFAEATMVVALGITMTGDKRFLGVSRRTRRTRRC